MRSRETSFAPSLYRVSTDTLIHVYMTVHHCLSMTTTASLRHISHHFLVSFLFLLHSCMYSCKVYNTNVGLTPKIWLSTGTKLDGYSYSYLPCFFSKVSPLHYV